jgi:hypothetical protein
MIDNVNHPSHYCQGGIECIDALKAATVGKTGIEAVCVANVIKYLWRYEEKNGLEDVNKAQWYINRLIQELSEAESNKYPVYNGVEPDGCYECAFCEDDEDKTPCKDCKGTAIPGTEEYKNRPYYFQWSKDEK